MKKIYLDYAATTPVDPLVAEKMKDYLTYEGCFANSSSHHRYGQEAAEAIHVAAGQVAQLIAAQPQELVWTSGATEANNFAIKGVAHFYQHKGKHIITAKNEHKSVLYSCRQLEKEGFEVTYLTPQRNGSINIEELEAAIRKDTLLVSLMHVNNETGVVHDLSAIAEKVKQHAVFLHVDAAQSIGKIPLSLQVLPIDLLSLSAHKVYGPKGIGALYVRRKPPVKLIPQIQGGGQQNGLRSGTLPTHQIVGMGEAFSLAQSRMDVDFKKISLLSNQLVEGLKKIPGVEFNTALSHAVPHILNISIKGIRSENLLGALANVALATGSACDSWQLESSYVLKSMGFDKERLRSAIRISLGRYTTANEIAELIKLITEKVRLL